MIGKTITDLGPGERPQRAAAAAALALGPWALAARAARLWAALVTSAVRR
jgi:hypothetical protein